VEVTNAITSAISDTANFADATTSALFDHEACARLPLLEASGEQREFELG
jgi:hypothetical protein